MRRILTTCVAGALLSGCGAATTAATPAGAPTPSQTPSPTPSAETAQPSPSPTSTAAGGHLLQDALDQTRSCADLAANFTYVRADEVAGQGGQPYVTYRPAKMHCGGPDDYQYVTEPGAHRVFVDPGAEVVLIHEGPDGIVEEPSTAAKLPAAYAAQHGAYPIFAIRHSSVGHADALVQRFHP